MTTAGDVGVVAGSIIGEHHADDVLIAAFGAACAEAARLDTEAAHAMRRSAMYALDDKIGQLRADRDRLAAELAAARAEVEVKNRRIAGLETQLRVTIPVPPLDASREAIVEAVEEWVNRSGGATTVDEIAMAVLEAAVQAGWIIPVACTGGTDAGRA